jgi:hypothetical protein
MAYQNEFDEWLSRISDWSFWRGKIFNMFIGTLDFVKELKLSNNQSFLQLSVISS